MRVMGWFLVGFAVACVPAASTVTLGGACSPEGSGACDPSAPRLFECAQGQWSLLADCLGAAGCSLDGGEVACDTSGNSVGAHCPPASEGKLRCDPDAGQVLQCSTGIYAAYATCRGPQGCLTGTDTISCDTSLDVAGDRCLPQTEGRAQCSPDAGQVLACLDGGFAAVDTCASPSFCLVSGGQVGCL
jgi:hypothetical protein